MMLHDLEYICQVTKGHTQLCQQQQQQLI